MQLTTSKIMLHRNHHTNQGFALVVSLTMLVLITVIAVGLLSLSSITLRTASQNSAQAEAQANAKMALMLAIGELQRELGPDQRVNAPASQLNPADESEEDVVPSGRQHWVGTYDSWNSVQDPAHREAKFRSWLVSGNNQGTREQEYALEEPATDDVTLFPGAEGSDALVKAPKVRLKGKANNNIGAYSWWVSDSGAKAVIEVKAEPDHAEPEQAYSDVQTAEASAYEWNAELAGYNWKSAEKKAGLAKLASYSSLDLVTDAGVSKSLFHDYALNSQAVLSDVAQGGLKRDLSLFQDHPVSKTLKEPYENGDWSVPEPLLDRGFTWEELWLFHNAWRALEFPVEDVATSTSGEDMSGVPMLITAPGVGDEESVKNFREDPYSFYKTPDMIRIQYIVSLLPVEIDDPGRAPEDPVEYDLHWVTDAIVWLWNPWDVPIALHPDAYMSLKLWALPYEVKVSKSSDGTEITKQSFSQISANSGNNIESFIMQFGTADLAGRNNKPHDQNLAPDPIVLMPGEVVIMSEGRADDEDYTSRISSSGILRFAAKAGWNNGAGRVVKPSGTTPALEGPDSLRLEVTPNGYGWSGQNIVSEFHGYYGSHGGGGASPSKFEFYSNHGVERGARAENFPDTFVSLDIDTPTVETMAASGKYPFFLFSFESKTEEDATSWSQHANHRSARRIYSLGDGKKQSEFGQKLLIQDLNGLMDPNLPQFSMDNDFRGLFGGSFRDNTLGVDTIIAQSIPREPPLSLGAFQHALANGFTGRLGSDSDHGINPVKNLVGGHTAPFLLRAISNSYALPMLAPDEFESDDYLDHSFQSNRALWDSWYLSSVVQRQALHHDEKRTRREVFQGFVDPDPSTFRPLPNPNFSPHLISTDDPEAMLFDGNGDDLKQEAPDRVASLMMVERAFNVNSTSVEAWKAMFGVLNEAMMPVYVEPSQSLSSVQAEGVGVSGLLAAFGGEDAAFDASILSQPGSQKQWKGFRELSEQEVTSLAEAMVEEVKKRGPFLSMADFINRRLSVDKDLALRGALQSALDATVNSTLLGAVDRVAGSDGQSFAFPEAMELPKSLVGPAHVHQADLLTAIGSRLSVRSDSFVVRAYGESLDSSGQVVGRAWCEAEVQRYPDYVDPADPAYAAEELNGRDVPVLAARANKDFGRRFQLKSFRWLSPDEMK